MPPIGAARNHGDRPIAGMARSYLQGDLHLDACPRFHAIPGEGSGPAILVREVAPVAHPPLFDLSKRTFP